MAKLEQVLKGIKATQAKGVKRTVRLPITPELFLKLKVAWTKGAGQDRDGCMLWAAACCGRQQHCSCAQGRSDTAYDEEAHLSVQDITADSLQNPRTLKVRIKASKTESG